MPGLARDNGNYQNTDRILSSGGHFRIAMASPYNIYIHAHMQDICLIHHLQDLGVWAMALEMVHRVHHLRENHFDSLSDKSKCKDLKSWETSFTCSHTTGTFISLWIGLLDFSSSHILTIITIVISLIYFMSLSATLGSLP